eukprot:COSAG06_NODE_55248_length_290_cov_1.083770_1_plen_50_part_10
MRVYPKRCNDKVESVFYRALLLRLLQLLRRLRLLLPLLLTAEQQQPQSNS